ncbi:Macrolide export protein MacA [Planctomycetes bacterium Pla163]|uniref:Macrolide export protein MacA n=1 Tax=Rohdeia mirabilis TaxID=2528008 RepID=A0A518D0P6_9BACT|nr:Macrolide export protein MacA [Planctomycetes bacterium Pla163]
MPRSLLTTLVVLAVLVGLGLLFQQRFEALDPGAPGTAAQRSAVPVEVGAIERGDLVLRRTFSGTLEPAAEFTAASKIAGRLKRLEVELGESVARGQVVARIDDAEFVQDVRRVEADLAVARASRSEAASALEIARRALERARSLGEEGLASASQLDAALASELAASARLEVTDAGIERAEAALESVHLRLADTLVTANWDGDDEERVVAARYLDEGGNVAANAPLLSIVRLDPLVCVVDVPERDYARLAVGQKAQLVADGYPDDRFEGRVERIAPVFRSSTRQARVELLVANTDLRLKPGMFVRATLELETVEDVLSAPADALTERSGDVGLFALDGATSTVRWIPVDVGIRTGNRVELRVADGALDAGDEVVTLGQELCEQGAAVAVRQRRTDARTSGAVERPTPRPSTTPDPTPDAATDSPGATPPPAR